MTDRTPADDDLLLEALDALDSTGVSTRLAAASPALRAEVDALRAVKAILGRDATWGLSSGTDAPPPHLMDAIVRAEVLARPDAIRQAVALTAAAPAAPRTLWSRMSSWLVGSGVVVGAAAALFITIQRPASEVAAPGVHAESVALSPPLTETAAVAAALEDTLNRAEGQPAADPKPTEPAAFQPARPDDGDNGADGLADGRGGVKGARLSVADASTGANRRDEFGKANAAKDAGGGAAALMDKKQLDAAEIQQDNDALALGYATSTRAKADAPATVSPPSPPPADEFDDAEAPSRARRASSVPATPAPSPSGPALLGATNGAFAAGPVPSAAAPEPAPVTAPRIVSADEARKNFMSKLGQLDSAKEKAKEEARDKAKSSSSSSLSKAEAKTAKKRPASEAESPDAAREQMFHSRQLQEANDMLLAAERELTLGRFDSGVDLASRAEAAAGGGLGLAPASTLTRGFVAMRRYADATRVASRLLGGDPADAQLVDGMLAGALAAEQIGDFRMAERLLTLAASPKNTDAARRAEAQKRLRALSGKGSLAPAKAAVRESAAASDKE